MRFRNPSLAGKRSAQVRAEKRLASDPPIYRPQEGLLVGILRYTDCVAGKSTEVKVYQARRMNQVVAETFGSRSKPHGWDWLMRRTVDETILPELRMSVMEIVPKHEK